VPRPGVADPAVEGVREEADRRQETAGLVPLRPEIVEPGEDLPGAPGLAGQPPDQDLGGGHPEGRRDPLVRDVADQEGPLAPREGKVVVEIPAHLPGGPEPPRQVEAPGVPGDRPGEEAHLGLPGDGQLPLGPGPLGGGGLPLGDPPDQVPPHGLEGRREGLHLPGAPERRDGGRQVPPGDPLRRPGELPQGTGDRSGAREGKRRQSDQTRPGQEELVALEGPLRLQEGLVGTRDAPEGPEGLDVLVALDQGEEQRRAQAEDQEHPRGQAEASGGRGLAPLRRGDGPLGGSGHGP